MLSTPSYPSHIVAFSTVIKLLSKATTPYTQPYLGLPSTSSSLASAINTLIAIRYSYILFKWPNHPKTRGSTTLVPFLFQLLFLLCTSSFLSLSIRVTPTKLLEHFISSIFFVTVVRLTVLLSALLILQVSAPHNAVSQHFSYFRSLPHTTPLVTPSSDTLRLFPILSTPI